MSASQESPITEAFAKVHFDSRSEFDAQLAAAFDSAQREIWLADADFSRWPLNAPAIEEKLRQFLLASRANRLQVLVHNGDALAASAPRFVRLLGMFSHAIVCRQPAEQVAARFREECCFAIVDRARSVRRFHRDSPRGVAEFHPNEVRPWVDQFSATWEDASPGLTATVLGLGA